jgi:metal-responsive CopG/Arc/MetJ family transcriptional regulator
MNYAQIVDICCRDLRRYLETALASAKGGVITVKMNRVMQIAPPPLDRRRYAMCLGGVLRRWRWNAGVYVIPRQDVLQLLESLDETCASINKRSQRPMEKREERMVAPPRSAVATDGKMILVSFHVPSALAKAVDEYAQRKNTTRSVIVRTAIAHLVEKYRNVEVDIQRPAAPAAPPVVPEDELVLVAFHETPYVVKLLDVYADALQVSRSDVIRVAIMHLLNKMYATEEESKHNVTV